MDPSKDYYAALNVSPSAEPEVITAAYRSLAKKYHPDIHPDKALGEDRLRDLNEAHAVLSDAALRRQYDEGRVQSESPFGQEAPSAAPMVDWTIACSFYPNIESERKRVEKLSPDLARAFQEHMLTEKNWGAVGNVAEAFEKAFLEKYFGASQLLCNFGKRLLLAGRRDLAGRLTEAIRVVGVNQGNQFTFIAAFCKQNNFQLPYSDITFEELRARLGEIGVWARTLDDRPGNPQWSLQVAGKKQFYTSEEDFKKRSIEILLARSP